MVKLLRAPSRSLSVTTRVWLPGLSVAALAGLVALQPTDATAQSTPRIDPSIATALAQPRIDWLRGRTAGPVHVLVELQPLASSATQATGDDLRARGARIGAMPGVTFERQHEEFVLVRVDPAGLRALEQSSLVRRAMRADNPTPRPPLDRSATLLSLEAARGMAFEQEAPHDRFTGEGVTIADIDTLVDVFHPAFFRGDAGWFSFIDVDGDGRLTAEVDAIDLNQDGIATDDETAHVLRPDYVDQVGGGSPPRPNRFDPATDWLYLDTDGNGARDVLLGQEDVPAYGEPIFTPDDADRSGYLEVNERMVRLGTSKVRVSHIDVTTGTRPPVIRDFYRGTDLSEIPRDITGGIYGYADTLHGTGVLGILAADLPLLGRSHVGIAPDAELISIWHVGESAVSPLMWALEENPQVMVHEYVVWTDVALDGGDALGALINRSADTLAHICPAGNIGGAGKHTELNATAGASLEMRFSVPSGVPYWALSLYAPPGAIQALTLHHADGSSEPFNQSSAPDLAGGGSLYSSLARSTRGTEMHSLTAYNETGSLASGAAYITFDIAAGVAPFKVHGFLNDSVSGFARGVAFDVATDASTIAWPATSDACTGVGSVPSHLDREGRWVYGGGEAAGEVRAYSGRGPRIDGAIGIHVVAPDNPVSTLGAGEVYPGGSRIAAEGAYTLFGGTSGAGPHVAGVAALLIESGVAPRDVRTRLTATALDDGRERLPSPNYGSGRLNALASLRNGRDITQGEAPTVTLEARPSVVSPGMPIMLVAAGSDADGDTLSYRFDDEYDGTWDSEYQGEATRSWTPTTGGYHWAKVRTRDAQGMVGEATVRVLVVPAGADAGIGGDGGIAPPSGGNCGCRVGGHSTNLSLATLAFGVVAGLSRRRRRR
jgi:MYXO-CTERM domain-containing protein